MKTRPSLLALASMALLIGCPKKGAGEEATPPLAAAQLATAEAPPPTLTPVDAPEDIFFQARVENPAAIFDELVAQWGKSYDWRARVDSEDPDILETFDPSAPVDLVVWVDPELEAQTPVHAAISFGVRSIEEMAAHMSEDGPTRDMGRGVVRESKEEGDFTCEVGPSRDAALGRVVCSFEGPEGLDRLSPYLRRGELASLALPTSMQASFDFDPLRRRFRPEFREAMQSGQMLASMGVASIQDPDFRNAAATALRAIFDEAANLYEDLGVMNFEAKLGGPDGGAQMAASIRMLGKEAYLSRILLAGEDQMAPPSDHFWGLPASASSASFVHSQLLPESIEVGRVLRALLVGAAREYGFPTKKLDKALELFAAMAVAVPTGEVLVATYPGGKVDPNWPDDLRKVVDGFGVLVISSPRFPDDMKALRAWVDMYNDRPMQKKLESFLPDGSSLPKLRWRKTGRADRLPSGSHEMILTLPRDWFPKDSKVKKGLSLSYLLVPTADRLLAGMSFDRGATAEVLREVLAPTGPTLATDPAARRFREQKVSRGGWTAIDGSNVTELLDRMRADGDLDSADAMAMAEVFTGWQGDWSGRSIPAMTSWSTVTGLTWTATSRIEGLAMKAALDLAERAIVEANASDTRPRGE
jgi:hypothetical protein